MACKERGESTMVAAGGGAATKKFPRTAIDFSEEEKDNSTENHRTRSRLSSLSTLF